MVRVRGRPQASCEGLCRERGCRLVVDGFTYDRCQTCADVPSQGGSNSYGGTFSACSTIYGTSEATCMAGCALGPGTAAQPPLPPPAPLPADSGSDDEGGVGRRASIASAVSADDGHEERESFLASAINLDAIAAVAPEPAKPEPAVPEAAIPEPRAKRRRRA